MISILDTRYWLRRKEDLVYRWNQFKSVSGPDANTPCNLVIEPYQAGMDRKKKG
ncbi:MAG: hypothetical protein J7485_12510 [Sphingobium sp.]|nr:hypothetical protein [Sphingobium sp.]